VETFLPGEILVREGELEERLCFIKSGIVQELDPETVRPPLPPRRARAETRWA